MTDVQLSLYTAAHSSLTAAFNCQVAAMDAENAHSLYKKECPAYVEKHYLEAMLNYRRNLGDLAHAYGIEVPN